MSRNKFCIATITWARNQTEEHVLKAALQQLAELNIPVFITDGGSRDSFIQFIKDIPHFHLLETVRGVQFQAKNSLLAAYKTETPFIFYTEPDKKDFFINGLPQLLQEKNLQENTGVIMASRSAAGLASFPAFQQQTEAAVNNCCAEIIGKKCDYTYGPFILNRTIIPYLELLTEDVGWGWRPYVFNIARRLGCEVEYIERNFSCPADQQQDDAKERLYRMKQLEQNIRGLLRSVEVKLQQQL